MKNHFKSSFLLAFILTEVTLIGHASYSFAQDTKSWPSPSLNCDSDFQKKLVIQPPLTQELIKQTLHPKALIKTANQAEFICAIGTKEWKLGKALIAILESQVYEKNEHGGANGRPRQLVLSVLNTPKTEKAMDVRAQVTSPIEFSSEDESLDSLDTAGYKIQSDEYAFGIRTSQHFMYAGGGGENIYLQLFRIQNKELVPILRTLVNSSSLTAGEYAEDGTRPHEDNQGGEATLSMSKTQTNGVFDLIKKKKNGKESMVYKWDGKAYQSKDAEIISDVNSN